MEQSEEKIHATKHSKEIAKSCKVHVGFGSINSWVNNLINQIKIRDKVIDNSSKADFSFLKPFYDWIYEGVYELEEKIVTQLVGWWAVDFLLEYRWTAVNCIVIRIEWNISNWQNNNSDASHACKSLSSPRRLFFFVRHCVTQCANS